MNHRGTETTEKTKACKREEKPVQAHGRRSVGGPCNRGRLRPGTYTLFLHTRPTDRRPWAFLYFSLSSAFSVFSLCFLCASVVSAFLVAAPNSAFDLPQCR